MPVRKKGNRKKKEASLEIPSDLYQYDKNEVVLCFHGPCLYKAKILKRTVNTERNQPLYFVHYHGWNQQWDEWVETERILKMTPENELRRQQIKEQIKSNTENSKKNKGNVSHNNNNINNNTKKKPNKKKRQIEDSEESESDTNNPDTANNTNNHNNNHKPHNSSSSDSSEHDEELQQLINQKNELKNKDLDDYTLNQKIAIHQNKKQKVAANLNGSMNAIAASTNNSKRDRHRKCRNMDKVEVSSNETKQQRIARKKFEEKLRTITIPTALKDNLVQQYHLIHYDEKLIKLPKANGFRINDILDEVLKDQQNKLQQKKEKKVEPDDLKSHQTIIELLPFINEGIRGFFKNTLKLNLLYNFEKPQLDIIYANVEDEDKDQVDLCNIYGAEHLIRLFYILPNILMHTQGINEHNFGQIKQCTSIIIQFLSKHKSKYLINYTSDSNEEHKNGKKIEEYVEMVDDEYHSKVRKIGKKYENRYHVGHLHND